MPAHARLAADDLETLRNFALRGAGIAMLIDYLARDPKLVRVLPKWSWRTGALSFVYPGQRFVPANVRAFIDTALATTSGSAARRGRGAAG
jgi:DNA-binding transcriptional LysR family regulator